MKQLSTQHFQHHHVTDQHSHSVSFGLIVYTHILSVSQLTGEKLWTSYRFCVRFSSEGFILCLGLTRGVCMTPANYSPQNRRCCCPCLFVGQQLLKHFICVTILLNVILGHDDEVTTESFGLPVAQKLVLRATPWKHIKPYWDFVSCLTIIFDVALNFMGWVIRCECFATLHAGVGKLEYSQKQVTVQTLPHGLTGIMSDLDTHRTLDSKHEAKILKHCHLQHGASLSFSSFNSLIWIRQRGSTM